MATTRTVTTGTPSAPESSSPEAPFGYGLFCAVFLGIYMLNQDAFLPALVIYTTLVASFNIFARVAALRTARSDTAFRTHLALR